ncbi:electron transport complex subunit RsxG [Motiliproteus sediminis]|uniref:electron transport complex subunit RsxG n=1 Tax=Motiliproteus sediminis TaxID=1468178 RepID=UPI001AEF3D4B|nr:electron transport complex subunit RsxG [Motiliproteus sediminis]
MIGQGVLKPSYTQRPGFFAGILGMMAALAGTLLVMGFVATKEDIELRAREDLQRSLAEVLPAGGYDNDPSADFVDLPRGDQPPLRIYQARLGEQPVALAFEQAEPGYSGDIRLVMGVSMSGDIIGVRVLSHTETPGLGDKIELAKDDWVLGFNGLSLTKLAEARWAVKKDGGEFDQFSGATITPRAVVKGVKRGLLLQREALGAAQLEALQIQSSTERMEDKP